MGAAGGLLQDQVDHAEAQHVLRRDLHAGGGFLRLGAVAPQDRGRRLRRDHAVDGVLEHQHAVGRRDRDGAARHALAGDDRDIGDAQRQAGVGGACDRLGLAALFGADAGIGAGGIDDRQHGNAEPVGHLHQPHRLAVALGARHAEIMLDAGFGGGALFLADHADALAAEAAEPADQRFILAELAVARERGEFGDQRVDEIGQMRALMMPRHQRLLPWRQIGIEFSQGLRSLLLDPRNFFANVAAGGRQRAQLIDLGVEFGDGLFKIEIGAAHVIRHLNNIGTKRRGREAVSGLRGEGTQFQSFSVRSGANRGPVSLSTREGRGREMAVSGEKATKSRRQSKPLLLRQRMQIADQALQPLLHHMGVDLRGRDVGVAEQRLHDAQVGAVVQQMARKRMTQHMR